MKFNGKTRFFRSFPYLDQAIDRALAQARQRAGRNAVHKIDASDIIREALLTSPVLFPLPPKSRTSEEHENISGNSSTRQLNSRA
jgi:hypothetical protein